ncbi:MAG: hydroxymethylpyrimidine/phosphomethylpyrimidine kinase [Methylomicrobium sp.]
MNDNRPVVLCFSGHDPSGGAGMQADIETLISHRCHAASIITTLTEQDTHNVKKLIPQRPENIIAQADTLIADLPVQAFKIGLIGHHESADAIHAILERHADIPVVLDPILAAGGGAELAGDRLIQTIKTSLLPRTTVLTPNSIEARKLSGYDNLDDCARALMDRGCRYVLITGTHEQSDTVCNRLYHDGRLLESFHWDRLPHSYHGSGCTLAAAIAGLTAWQLPLFNAIHEAQDYTWNALNNAYRPGSGQYNPNRFFWMEDDA